MRIAVDTGGTFTDCVFVRDGRLEIVKVPSQRAMPEEAIASAVRAVRKPLKPMQVFSDERGLELVCGTTVGTNALLERRGGRVALVTTAGFEDVLEIGRQARPKLYDFFVDKPEPLVGARERIGARERLAWDGTVVTSLTAREIARVAGVVKRAGPDAVAVCFLFSFRNAKHEARIAAALRRAGYLVSVSHEILPEFREYERTSTTVINAYLAPVMSGYLAGIHSRARTAWFSGPKPRTFGAPKRARPHHAIERRRRVGRKSGAPAGDDDFIGAGGRSDWRGLRGAVGRNRESHHVRYGRDFDGRRVTVGRIAHDERVDGGGISGGRADAGDSHCWRGRRIDCAIRSRRRVACRTRECRSGAGADLLWARRVADGHGRACGARAFWRRRIAGRKFSAGCGAGAASDGGRSWEDEKLTGRLRASRNSRRGFSRSPTR